MCKINNIIFPPIFFISQSHTISVIQNAWTPSTPTINNILFGDKLDDDMKKSGQNIEQYKGVHGTIDALDEFLNFNTFQDKEYDTIKENGVIETSLAENYVLDANLRTEENLDCLEDSTDETSISDITEKKRNGKHVIIEENDNKIRIKIKRKTEDTCTVNKKNLGQLNSVEINDKENNTENVVSNLFPNENEYCSKELLCRICNMKFNKLRFLKIHFTKKHKMTIDPRIKSQVKRICAYCGLETKQSLSRFLKHIDKHVVCIWC